METSLKANWYTNPTKKQVAIFTFLWFVGIGLLIVATTDAFTESFLNKKYTVLYMIMIGATLSAARLIRNYVKNKK